MIAWINFCNQSAMIVSPLVVSAIYPKSKEAVYYVSSIFSMVALVIMSFLSCRKDAKKLGKEPTGGLMKVMDNSADNKFEMV